ncbi:MAG: GNAT family N-acetyltransferase [Candidatus Peribacteraceae bacterium]|jgi:ribosomal protein S18 acetylase RimI-like enzyme|nr:GNAT family N-acetyltransferase [Candidatus Peribacteraceae bacterium]
MKKMKIIRLYRREDHENLIHLIVQLQEHIASLDPYHRQKSGSDFDAEAYVKKTLKKVQEEHGAIFVAKTDGEISGCIIGCIPEPSDADMLESYPVKEGSILELIVAEKSRGSGLGSELMKVMEEYFLKCGCKFSRVACFAPNADAHIFYKKYGYGDRNIDMLKRLK